MAAKITLERILRDADDASGQSIRDYKIESEPGYVTIRMKHGDGFIHLRATDIDILTADLERAKEAASSLREDREPR